MKKIVIVDDEMLIRIGIMSSLNWEEYGFEIVGQAENGIQALEVIEATHPDIVMTDLKMPKMGGLDLIEEVKKRFSNIKIVVLSCLNEIEYVKKAMKLGAEDYLLKLSIEPETLLDVLNKVKQQIEKESHEDTPTGTITTRGFDAGFNNYVIKEDIYKKMVAGSMSMDDFANELGTFGMSIDEGRYAVICCGIDDHSNAPTKSKMDDRYLFKYSFINILVEMLNIYGKCEISEIEDGKYIILLKHPSGNTLSKEGISSRFKRINNSLKKYLNSSISFGVHLVTDNYTKIQDAYILAQAAMEFKFYFGQESITFTDEVSEFARITLFFSNADDETLREKLETFDEESVKEWIDTYFNDLIKSQSFSMAC